MQGKIYKIAKILGRMNSRTVMMERFQDVEFSWHCCPQKTVTIPRSVCVLYLLFTQPSLIRSFHSSDRCFSVSCPKGVGYVRVYCTPITLLPELLYTLESMAWLQVIRQHLTLSHHAHPSLLHNYIDCMQEHMRKVIAMAITCKNYIRFLLRHA